MKYYSLKFGSGDPRTYTGMNATFLYFVNMTNGATLAPPAITESLTGSGIYQFQWGTTTPIAFLADAATTSPGAALRYITGELDPADRADEYGASMIALGTTHIGQGVTSIALGTSNIALGTTAVALGTTLIGIGLSSIALGTTITNWIGSTSSLIGNSTTMPSNLFGYLRRVDALLEGQQRFTKGNPATLVQYDWTGATTLSSRSITNSVTLVTKV